MKGNVSKVIMLVAGILILAALVLFLVISLNGRIDPEIINDTPPDMLPSHFPVHI